MKTSRFLSGRLDQAGAVLFVCMILMILLTLFVLAAINVTNIESRIAGNLQARNELKAVDQQAIEQVINTNFTTNPTDSIILFDVNGDSKDDYEVTVSHTCVSSIPIPVDQLDITIPDDASCTMSASMQSSGIAGTAPSSASLCASSVFDVKATGIDATTATFKTNAAVTTHQGVAVRVGTGTGC